MNDTSRLLGDGGCDGSRTVFVVLLLRQIEVVLLMYLNLIEEDARMSGMNWGKVAKENLSIRRSQENRIEVLRPAVGSLSGLSLEESLAQHERSKLQTESKPLRNGSVSPLVAHFRLLADECRESGALERLTDAELDECRNIFLATNQRLNGQLFKRHRRPRSSTTSKAKA